MRLALNGLLDTDNARHHLAAGNTTPTHNLMAAALVDGIVR
jgi:hypothetical protein